MKMGHVNRERCLLCDNPNREPIFEKEGARYVRCLQCGLVYSDRVPGDDELASVAEEWATKHHASPERLEWEKSVILGDALFKGRMKIIGCYKKTGKLLDVGCSTGYFLEYAKSRGWEISGCELSQYTASLSRGRLNADVRSGSFLDAGFPDDSFDAVTMWDVIEHVLEPASFIKEAFRALRPGGLLVICTPNYNSLSRRMLGYKWDAVCPPRHLQMFNSATLSKMVVRNGGKVVLSRTLDVNPFEIWSRLIGGGEDLERREANVSRVKGLFARYPALSYAREALNMILDFASLGDVLEIYAEKVA